MVSVVEPRRREELGGSGGEPAWMLANLSESKLSLPTWGACRRSIRTQLPANGAPDVFRGLFCPVAELSDLNRDRVGTSEMTRRFRRGYVLVIEQGPAGSQLCLAPVLGAKLRGCLQSVCQNCSPGAPLPTPEWQGPSPCSGA